MGDTIRSAGKNKDTRASEPVKILNPTQNCTEKTLAPTHYCSNARHVLKFLYTNMDTFLNKKDSLLLRIHTNDPDIIALTEIKPKFCRYPLQL